MFPEIAPPNSNRVPDGTVLKSPAYCFKRIGLEAGPLSQWLFGALAEAHLRGHRTCVDFRPPDLDLECASRPFVTPSGNGVCIARRPLRNSIRCGLGRRKSGEPLFDPRYAKKPKPTKPAISIVHVEGNGVANPAVKETLSRYVNAGLFQSGKRAYQNQFPRHSN